MKHLALAAAAALCASSVSAQCSLQVNGTGAAGTTLSFAMQTDANAACALVISDTLATNPIFPNLTLNVGAPFLTYGMGVADANGDAQRDFLLPSGLVASSWFAQGVSLDLSTLGTCGTSAESFSIL